MKLPKSLTTRTFAVIGLTVVIYAALVLFAGWEAIRTELGRFPSRLLAPLALLSLANYLLRFLRWEMLLRSLHVRIPGRESAGIYFATYLMVITPGKIGEIFKAGILRERYGTNLGLGLPAVLAERLFDFLAVLILAVTGIFFWPGSLSGLSVGLVAAASVPLLLALFQNRAVRRWLLGKAAAAPLLSRYQFGLDTASEALSRLLGLRIGAPALGLSVIAWLAEGLGLALVCHGLGLAVPVGRAIFVYAAGTLVGSLSFLPGGLGGTEATIIWLLESLGMSLTTAATVALLVRLFTLWLAVLVGLVFFGLYRRLFNAPPSPDGDPG